MKTELRNKWVAALRSGEYRQCGGRLEKRDDDGRKYCCLGVACLVVEAEGIEVIRGVANGETVLVGNSLSTMGFQQDVADALGLTPKGERKLVVMNDKFAAGKAMEGGLKYSFDEIADYIEKNEGVLFHE